MQAADAAIPAPPSGRGPTFGEKAVGISFNPSQDPLVHDLKALYARIIDLCATNRANDSPERARLWSIAITEAQGAQMWAVKAATWKDT